MLDELKRQLESKKESIKSMIQKNPRRAYSELNQLAHMASAKHGVVLQLHFPDARKLNEVDSYGNENIGVVVDPYRKRFPIPRDVIKEKAKEFLGEIDTQDAYMYEGKEGLKIFLKGGRMDILPGSLHLWCKIDDSVKKFVDWLLPQCYGIRNTK